MDAFRLTGPLVLIALIFVAGLSAPAHSSLRSGAKGVVYIGPTCPVQGPNVCPDWRRVAAHVKVTAGDKSVYTSENGNFVLELKPGRYTITAFSNSGYPSSASKAIRVHAGGFTAVTLTLDSGIR